MDFFQLQDKARNRTVFLVVLYCLGLLGMTAVMVPAMLLLYAYMEIDSDPMVMLVVIGTILGVVIIGSLGKMTQLSESGGRGVAESLGGRLVCASTTDPAERRLHNIVEEMALAAGVPMPCLYVLDRERSINAFAAGFSLCSAVIGVNRGTIDLLTRDELQGVIAHEFSHILNGDMRMNMRLIGILYGYQSVAINGYYVMRFAWFIARGVNLVALVVAAVVAIAGLALFAIGYIGVLFSALIQAAISRQREYLADASAVQFTRNPYGIADALTKIGAPNIGSNVSHPRAIEASHLFFGNTCGLFTLGELLATQPDLTTRIKRLDPYFDGRFPEIVDTRPKPEPYVYKTRADIHKARADNFLKHRPPTCSKQSVIENIGGLNISCLLTAGAMLDAIPKDVSALADNPLTAQAVLFALLLDPDATIRNRQFNQITLASSDFLAKESQRLYPQIRSLPEEEKIPLAQHVSATLREMTAGQYRKFSRALELMSSIDSGTDLFQYTIKAMLHRDLDIHFGEARQLCVRYKTLSSVFQPVAMVLSHLAYSGHTNHDEALGAFLAAQQELELPAAILPKSEMTVKNFDQSLRKLAETCPSLKKQIFAAFMTCIWHDGTITPKEAGLIRAIAAMLAIPMPVLS
jgi:Zn-dependent protease with chaperone function